MKYDSELYDLTHAGNPGDIEYYLNACRGAKSVLELGCGTGRIAMEIAAAGCKVVGLDIDPGLAERFKERAKSYDFSKDNTPEIILQDMQQFDLQRKFDRIIIPYNTLLCLLSEKEIVNCLTAAKNHLSEKGEIIFDFYYVTQQHLLGPDEADDAPEHILTLSGPKGIIEVYERDLKHQDPRRLDVAYVYHKLNPTDPLQYDAVEYTIKQRCIFINEIKDLLKKAGLKQTAMKADFKNKPVDDYSEQIIVHAQNI